MSTGHASDATHADVNVFLNRTTFKGGIAVLAAICLLATLSPFTFGMPGFGLDASWIAVLGEAQALDLKLGKNIIFTGGPLSSIYMRWFDPNNVNMIMALKLLIMASAAGLIAEMTSIGPRPFSGVLFCALILSGIDIPDAIYFTIPMLTGLLTIHSTTDQRIISVRRATIILGILASAISGLAKFSVTPIAVVTFVIADCILIYRRQFPYLTIVFIASYCILFSAIEGPENLAPFIIGSLAVSSGYTDAMSVPGSVPELITYFFVALSVIGLAALNEFHSRLKSDRLAKQYPESFARFCILGLTLFMSFKAGFVRHDLHSIIAWSGLAFCTLAYVLTAPPDTAKLTTSILAILRVVGCFSGLIVIPWLWYSNSVGPGELYSRWGSHVASAFRSALDYASGPSAWIQAKELEKDSAWAQVRAGLPLPKLEGSIDAIPSVQSSILAHHLNYLPRWSFQDYATYSARLIARNLADLTNNGPEYVLFDPAITNIDRRFPSLSEGYLWPGLLRAYSPVDQAGSSLILRKRSRQSGAKSLSTATPLNIQFNSALTLPQTAPQFMTAIITKTYLGMIASVVFKPPVIFMRATFDNGEQRRFRIIPELARAGFIVTPFLGFSEDYLALALGEPSSLRRITKLSFEIDRFGAHFYDNDIKVTLQSIAVRKPKAALVGEDASRFAEKKRYFMRMRSSPGTSQIREGIMSHAPNIFSTTIDKHATTLRIEYGILDPAWKMQNGSDGVCFNVDRVRDSRKERISQRCLNPAQAAQDRGLQIQSVDVDLDVGDQLSFETACLANCKLDWSYWADVTVE